MPAFIALLLLGGPPATAAGAQFPRSVSASYNLYLNGAHVAVMQETFEAREARYRIVSETVPVGLLARFQKPARLESSGRITPGGLQPERFEGRRLGGGEVRAEFDWQAGQLTFGRDGAVETAAVEPGTQDRLSIMYQFAFTQPRDAGEIELAMTDGRRLASHRYVVTPGVETDTPLGRIAAVHLARAAGAGGGGTEIWLAPQRGSLPVRMVIREANGTRYEQVATRIEFGAGPP
ncbi:MAG: DUF3108 domain-containing protein [Burkholderiales bacterium]|nr:DUF3108 domain-containing protein [Burkholderiales bacterium]